MNDLALNELLKVLMSLCSFLYEPRGDQPSRYRFVDSHAVTSFGDAYIVLASHALRIRIVRDRGEVIAEFQPDQPVKENDWYDLGLVRRHLTSTSADSADVDEEGAKFLRENLETIEDLFSPERFEETSNALRELGRLRAKEIFG